MRIQKYQLERALATALAQYKETMEEPFPVVPILDVIDDPEFWAVAKLDDDKFRIRVSSGTAVSTTKLWTSVFIDEGFVPSFEKAVGTDAGTMTHISLVWLMLHEMHHFQMGHFGGYTPPNLAMKSTQKEHWLVNRTKKSSVPQSSASPYLSLILEMQADHDATEMMLDAYSPDEWISLRARVAAISAVMMLIEQADSSNQLFAATHPKAATRIFQLLGHLVDMPLLSAQRDLNKKGVQTHLNYLPSQAEQESFARQVVVPAFFDAVTLATVTATRSITDDLCSATDFFHDVQVAKLISDAGSDEFVTSGAKQWISLIKFRDKAVL